MMNCERNVQRINAHGGQPIQANTQINKMRTTVPIINATRNDWLHMGVRGIRAKAETLNGERKSGYGVWQRIARQSSMYSRPMVEQGVSAVEKQAFGFSRLTTSVAMVLKSAGKLAYEAAMRSIASSKNPVIRQAIKCFASTAMPVAISTVAFVHIGIKAEGAN